jgi:uncharacterized protein YneF (UPF0154 family)
MKAKKTKKEIVCEIVIGVILGLWIASPIIYAEFAKHNIIKEHYEQTRQYSN